MISKHNVAKQQKQNEEMKNRMATLQKKLVASPGYKKLNRKNGDIPYAVNTEIMKQEVRDKTSELAQKAFWFSEKKPLYKKLRLIIFFCIFLCTIHLKKIKSKTGEGWKMPSLILIIGLCVMR